MTMVDARQERRAERRRALGRRWGALAGAVAATVLALLVGTDLAHALLIGSALAAAALVTRALPLGSRASWPVLPYGRRDGARRDVSSLTWTMIDRNGVISSTGEARLRTVLTSALELRGVDLAAPSGRAQAATVVGDQVARWLTDTDAPTPDPRTVRRVLTGMLQTDDPTTKGSS